MVYMTVEDFESLPSSWVTGTLWKPLWSCRWYNCSLFFGCDSHQSGGTEHVIASPRFTDTAYSTQREGCMEFWRLKRKFTYDRCCKRKQPRVLSLSSTNLTKDRKVEILLHE